MLFNGVHLKLEMVMGRFLQRDKEGTGDCPPSCYALCWDGKMVNFWRDKVLYEILVWTNTISFPYPFIRDSYVPTKVGFFAWKVSWECILLVF